MDQIAVFIFYDFDGSMRGDRPFAVKRHNRREIIVLEECQDLLTVFFTEIFGDVHAAPCRYQRLFSVCKRICFTVASTVRLDVSTISHP